MWSDRVHTPSWRVNKKLFLRLSHIPLAYNGFDFSYNLKIIKYIKDACTVTYHQTFIHQTPILETFLPQNSFSRSLTCTSNCLQIVQLKAMLLQDFNHMKSDPKVECEFSSQNDSLLKENQNHKADPTRHLKVIGFIVFDIEFYFTTILRDCPE